MVCGIVAKQDRSIAHKRSIKFNNFDASKRSVGSPGLKSLPSYVSNLSKRVKENSLLVNGLHFRGYIKRAVLKLAFFLHKTYDSLRVSFPSALAVKCVLNFEIKTSTNRNIWIEIHKSFAYMGFVCGKSKNTYLSERIWKILNHLYVLLFPNKTYRIDLNQYGTNILKKYYDSYSKWTR